MSDQDTAPETTRSRPSMRQGASQVRDAYHIFLSELPSRTVSALRWLMALSVIVIIFEQVQMFFAESDKKTLQKQEIVDKVRAAAHNAAERATQLRDVVAVDNTIRTNVLMRDQNQVFVRLLSIKEAFDDSLVTFTNKEAAPPPSEQYSVAIYDKSRRLMAWNSSIPLRTPWDSVLSGLNYIENKSRAIYVENDGEYIWLIGLRKISDTTSLGYVVSRALLAYAPDEKHANVQSFNFVDAVATETEHSLDIDYEARPNPTGRSAEPFSIIAEQGEPATFVGMLRIGEATAHRDTGVLRIVVALRELLCGILIYFFFGSLIYVLLKRRDLRDNAKLRLQVSEVIFALFVVARVAIMLLGNFVTLLPEKVRNTDVFGVADLAGIAGNPIELFLTVVPFAICIAIIARVITSSSGPRQVTIPFWKFTLYFLSFIGLQIGLIYGFKLGLNNIIVNSTVSPYPITQAVPGLPELCVYFSIIAVGFVYCIATATSLIWLLTASIPIMRLDNYELLVGRGVVLVIVVLLFASAALSFFSPSPGILLADNYWLITAISILVITAIVWLAQLKGDPSTMVSKFSLTSGLSILVLVSGGSLVVAPLLTSLEFEKQVASLELSSAKSEERSFEHAAKLEAAFMERQSEVADSTLSGWAYSFWKQYLRGEDVGASVIVTDGKKIYSEYGQTNAPVDKAELIAYADSIVRDLRRIRTIYSVRIYAADSLPVSSAVTDLSVIGVKRLDSVGGGRYIAVFLTPASAGRGAQPLFSTSVQYDERDQRIIQAVYDDNTLRETSNPSFNIPVHLPTDLYRRTFASNEPMRVDLQVDQEQYLFVVQGSASDPTMTLASGLRIPGLAEVLETSLYVHFIGILLAIIFAILNFFLRVFFTSQQQVFIRFRERILLIVIVLAFIPLVLVTNVTRSLLAEREQTQHREQLAIDADVAVNRLRDYSGPGDSLKAGTVLREAATTLHRSIQLYDTLGLLRIANDEKLVQAGFISPALDIEAVKEILVNGKTFAIEDVTVGSTTVVRSAFQVLPSPATNRPIGILAVREITSASSQEADIAATISFIYGIFAAIAVVLLLIGALFAYLVSRPISKVIQATEQVAGGAYGVVVLVDRKDEMGDLANAFNRMSFELDKSRERLAQSEREVAWKEMARQVAHEIKNPLTPMKLSVQHVEHAYETKDENFETIFKRVMRTLSEQINVLTRIASEFARFGEMPRRKYAFVSLKNVIESAIALFDADRGRIRFVIEVPDNLSSIYADEEEFRRTLVNLIRNAVQAIEKWGVIIVSATERHGIIHLRITDTGSGIGKETLARIFDPNFSTKTSGMGLGLAIVKRSITDMSGQISVESEVGKGTTFHIELPAREAPHS